LLKNHVVSRSKQATLLQKKKPLVYWRAGINRC